MNNESWWAERRRAAEFWHKIRNTQTAPRPAPAPDPKFL